MSELFGQFLREWDQMTNEERRIFLETIRSKGPPPLKKAFENWTASTPGKAG
jgi:hypothetical protein